MFVNKGLTKVGKAEVKIDQDFSNKISNKVED
jgi:hypothetical protein